MVSFSHKDQTGINERLLEILKLTEKDLGINLGVTSGYRSPAYNKAVGGARKSMHTHGLASDLSMKGMNESQRASLVNTLRKNGTTGFITYSKHPDMLHVDLREKEHFMFDKSSRYMANAPAWFQELAGMKVEKAAKPATTQTIDPKAPLSQQPDLIGQVMAAVKPAQTSADPKAHNAMQAQYKQQFLSNPELNIVLAGKAVTDAAVKNAQAMTTPNNGLNTLLGGVATMLTQKQEAPPPMSLSQMASLFGPRLQWASL